MIQDQRDGLLVDIDNTEQLLEAMRSVRLAREDPEERLLRAQRCVERFGSEAFVDRYARIYADATGRLK